MLTNQNLLFRSTNTIFWKVTKVHPEARCHQIHEEDQPSPRSLLLLPLLPSQLDHLLHFHLTVNRNLNLLAQHPILDPHPTHLSQAQVHTTNKEEGVLDQLRARALKYTCRLSDLRDRKLITVFYCVHLSEGANLQALHIYTTFVTFFFDSTSFLSL